jgi:signal transduction histidine kinase
MAKRFKRTQYIIAKQFQLRFSILLSVVGVAVTAIIGFILYGVLAKTQSLLLGTNIVLSPEVIDFLQQQRSLFLYSLLGTFVGVTVVLLVMGIFVSHRLAGPIFAIGRKMNDLSQGNFNATLHLRKNDEFQDLKDKFNNLVKSLQNQVKSELIKMNSVLGALKIALDNEGEPTKLHENLRSAYMELQSFYTYKKNLIERESAQSFKPADTTEDEVLV